MTTQTFKLALMRHTPSGNVNVYTDSDVRTYEPCGKFTRISEFVEVSFPLIDVPVEDQLASLERQNQAAAQRYADECARIDAEVAKIRKGAV